MSSFTDLDQELDQNYPKEDKTWSSYGTVKVPYLTFVATWPETYQNAPQPQYCAFQWPLIDESDNQLLNKIKERSQKWASLVSQERGRINPTISKTKDQEENEIAWRKVLTNISTRLGYEFEPMKEEESRAFIIKELMGYYEMAGGEVGIVYGTHGEYSCVVKKTGIVFT